jgi:hypothetical protein
MNYENQLSIINSMLGKVIMLSDATWDRDRLIEASDNVKKVLWGIKKKNHSE